MHGRMAWDVSWRAVGKLTSTDMPYGMLLLNVRNDRLRSGASCGVNRLGMCRTRHTPHPTSVTSNTPRQPHLGRRQEDGPVVPGHLGRRRRRLELPHGRVRAPEAGCCPLPGGAAAATTAAGAGVPRRRGCGRQGLVVHGDLTTNLLWPQQKQAEMGDNTDVRLLNCCGGSCVPYKAAGARL